MRKDLTQRSYCYHLRCLAWLTIVPPPSHGSHRPFTPISTTAPMSANHSFSRPRVDEFQDFRRFANRLPRRDRNFYWCRNIELVFSLTSFLTLLLPSLLCFFHKFLSRTYRITTMATLNPITDPIKIPDDEAELVPITNPPLFSEDAKLSRKVLVGKVISVKNVNKYGALSNFKSMWEDLGILHIQDNGNNEYIFTFKKEEDANLVLSRSPWFVMNCLLSLQVWGKAKSIKEVNFDLVPFWIQVHGLPLSALTAESVTAIMSRVGKITKQENAIVDGKIIRPFARVRVFVNIAKPIWAGSWISVENGKRKWIVFKYERLQGLCYNCGLIGHEQKICKNPKVMASFDKLKPKFGPFLSAATPRPLSSLMKEKVPVNIDTNRLHSGSTQFVPRSVQGNEEQSENDLMEEGQGSTGTNVLLSKEMPRESQDRMDPGGQQANQEQRQAAQAQIQLNREEEIINTVEGSWLGNMAKLDFPINVIDLTSQSAEDPNQVMIFTPSPFGPELLSNAQEEVNASDSWTSAAHHLLPLAVMEEIGGTSSLGKTKLDIGECSKGGKQINEWEVDEGYLIELPIEEQQSLVPFSNSRMDLATEKELIKTWNNRFTLKRERVAGIEIEELEDISRKKKQKKESWYDDEGNLICVTISSAQGTQTFVVNEEGGLKPQSP